MRWLLDEQYDKLIEEAKESGRREERERMGKLLGGMDLYYTDRYMPDLGPYLHWTQITTIIEPALNAKLEDTKPSSSS